MSNKKQSTLAGSIVAPMAEVRAAEADGMEFVSETVKPQGKIRHFAEGKKPGRRPLAEGGKRNGEGESAQGKTPATLTEEGVKYGAWALSESGWTRLIDGAGIITVTQAAQYAAEAKNLPVPPAERSALALPEWLAFFGVRMSSKPTSEERKAFADVMGYIGLGK